MKSTIYLNESICVLKAAFASLALYARVHTDAYVVQSINNIYIRLGIIYLDRETTLKYCLVYNDS